MTTAIWNFAKRHKKKIVFAVSLLAGFWSTRKWLQCRITKIIYDRNKNNFDALSRQCFIESNMVTGATAVFSMLETLRVQLAALLNSEKIIESLKTVSSTQEMVYLWEDLKIISVARCVMAVYACCLLVTFQCVQLNVIAGYVFVDTVSSMVGAHLPRRLDRDSGVLTAVKQEYLGLIRHLLTEGVVELARGVKLATEEEVEHISLKEQISADRFQKIVTAVREKMECGMSCVPPAPSTHPLCQHLMPMERVPGIEVVTAQEELFEKVLMETRDVLDMSDFHTVLRLCLDKGFQRLLHYVSNDLLLKANYAANMESKPDCATLPFAKVVPIADSFMHSILSDQPNPFIQDLLQMEEMRMFAANIFEAFSQYS